MSLKTMFNNVEATAYGLAIPFLGSAVGVKAAILAAKTMHNPVIATVIAQNAVPAFGVAASLYVCKMVSEAAPSAASSVKFAACASAMMMGSIMTIDHFDKGPFFIYEKDKDASHYTLSIRPSDL